MGTPMNLSALDEVGQASRRNPIDTDCSQQQQDDLRDSRLDDVSQQNELMRENCEQQDGYFAEKGEYSGPSGQMQRMSFNAVSRSTMQNDQKANPLFYDSLQDPGTHCSLASSKAAAQH